MIFQTCLPTIYTYMVAVSMIVVQAVEGTCNLRCPEHQHCVWKETRCVFDNCPRHQVCVGRSEPTIQSDNAIQYSGTTLKLCPGQPTNGPCVEQCRSDGDCRSNESCCFNGCGHTCRRTRRQNFVKPGSCPWHTRFNRRTCNRECSTDHDCSGLLKCCQTGCGSACTEPCFHWLRAFPTSSMPWKLPQRCSRFNL